MASKKGGDWMDVFDADGLEKQLLDLSRKSQDGDIESAKKITELVNSVNGNLIAISDQLPEYILLVLTILSGELLQIARIKPQRALYRHNERMNELARSLIVSEGLFIQETLAYKCAGPNLTRFNAVILKINRFDIAAEPYKTGL